MLDIVIIVNIDCYFRVCKLDLFGEFDVVKEGIFDVRGVIFLDL